jgi:NADH-quinone oxidoreductase subunit M
MLPLVGALVLLILPSWNAQLLRLTSLAFSSITFLLSLFLWGYFFFDRSIFQFQCVELNTWISDLNLNFTLGIDHPRISDLNLNFTLGINGTTLFFITLTALLILLCILESWDGIKIYVKAYLISFLVLESFLIGVFSVLDSLPFYIFTEVLLIFIFLIILFWGSNERKVGTFYLLFLNTLLGSLLTLLLVFYAFYMQ